MPDHAKLIIVEPMITTPNQRDFAKYTDVFMMAITGGKERSETEFKELLDHAGFEIESLNATDTEFYLIEATKRKVTK
jgi:hypothetical protein